MNYNFFLKDKLNYFFSGLLFLSFHAIAQGQVKQITTILEKLPQPIFQIKTTNDFIFKTIENKKDAAPDAFYVINISQLLNQHQEWERSLPMIKPFYAVKVNPDPILLKTLILLNLGFDCASINEIKQILSLGGMPKNIIYAHPIKSEKSIHQAYKLGVKMMTFDTLDELKKMQRLAPKGVFILRIKVNDSNSANSLGEKFGADQIEAKNIIEYAAHNQIVIQGISFHVGSNCLDILQYEQAIEDAYKLFTFAQLHGTNFRYLDLGGGWPGDNNLAFHEITRRVNLALNKFSHFKALKLIAEPGRFYATSSMSVAVKIIAKKDLSKTTKAYYLADGAFGLFGSSIYYGYDNNLIKQEGWQLRPLLNQNIDKTIREEKTYSSILFGPTCDAGDKIGTSVQLPDLKVGTYLYSHNMGAYTLATLSRFNQITPPEPFYVYQGI